MVTTQLNSRRAFLTACLALAIGGGALAQTGQPNSPAQVTGTNRFITVASTTSTSDSGLFEHLLPAFQRASGIEVRVISQGTGQALDTGRRGDADVVFVHAKAQEQKFVADGFGVERKPVMYNDFVLIGPKQDPAAIKGSRDVAVALQSIKAKAAPFVSRGDKSGTHAAELNLWKLAAVDLDQSKGTWYREIGQGMGAALNTASAMGAYVLSDRATWLNFRNRGDLEIIVEGDRRLFNQYGVMLVNPARHAHVKKDDGQRFVDWLLGPDGQRAINDYKINGAQLFFANATQPGA
jgi:tungstate transport system substrate-binding protein